MPFAPGSKVRYLWREEGAGATVTKIFRSAVVLDFLQPVAAVPFRPAKPALLRTFEERTPGADGVDHVKTGVETVDAAVPEQPALPGSPGIYLLEVTFLTPDLPALSHVDHPEGQAHAGNPVAAVDTVRQLTCAEGEVAAP